MTFFFPAVADLLKQWTRVQLELLHTYISIYQNVTLKANLSSCIFIRLENDKHWQSPFMKPILFRKKINKYYLPVQ